MKLDVKTIQTLKAFAMINPSLVFTPGSLLKTVSPSKTVMAKAIVPDVFDREFAIYDLMRFLGAYSMFEEAELQFGHKSVIIGSGKECINYRYTDPAVVVTPGDKVIDMPSTIVTFELTNDMIQRTVKALGMIGAPEVAITGEEGTVYLEALDSRNSSGSTYRVELGDTDKTFRLIMTAEKLKLLPCDYSVTVTDRIVHFEGDNIEYWIVLEANSTVE